MLDISQKSEQTKEKKQNTSKNKKQIQPISGEGKPNKKISRNSKKFLKNVAAGGFGYITK